MVGLAAVTFRGADWWAVASLVAGGLIALAIGLWLRGNHADVHRVFLAIGLIALLSCLPRTVELSRDEIRARAARE